MMQAKTCSKCNTDKLIDDFPPTRRTGNPSGICRECTRLAARARYKRWRDANIEKVRADAKRWRDANKDKTSAYGKKRYQANRERIRAEAAVYRAANLEKIREISRISARKAYRSNPEMYRERCRRWASENVEYNKARHRRRRQEHPEAGAQAAHRRRARVRNAKIGKVRPLAVMVKEQGGKCYLCGRRFTKKDQATVEHYIPLDKGGEHSDSNTLAAHRSCNQRKSNALPSEYATRTQRLII